MATTEGATRAGLVRRASAALYRHPRARLALTLGAPLGWILLIYLVSLILLLANSFWRVDPLTTRVLHRFNHFSTYESVFWSTTTYYRIAAARGNAMLIGVV